MEKRFRAQTAVMCCGLLRVRGTLFEAENTVEFLKQVSFNVLTEKEEDAAKKDVKV